MYNKAENDHCGLDLEGVVIIIVLIILSDINFRIILIYIYKFQIISYEQQIIGKNFLIAINEEIMSNINSNLSNMFSILYQTGKRHKSNWILQNFEFIIFCCKSLKQNSFFFKKKLEKFENCGYLFTLLKRYQNFPTSSVFPIPTTNNRPIKK